MEFRDRTKGYASATIRLFVNLPEAREEVRVLGKQLFRNLAARCKRLMNPKCGSSCSARIAGLLPKTP